MPTQTGACQSAISTTPGRRSSRRSTEASRRSCSIRSCVARMSSDGWRRHPRTSCSFRIRCVDRALMRTRCSQSTRERSGTSRALSRFSALGRESSRCLPRARAHPIGRCSALASTRLRSTKSCGRTRRRTSRPRFCPAGRRCPCRTTRSCCWPAPARTRRTTSVGHSTQRQHGRLSPPTRSRQRSRPTCCPPSTCRGSIRRTRRTTLSRKRPRGPLSRQAGRRAKPSRGRCGRRAPLGPLEGRARHYARLPRRAPQARLDADLAPSAALPQDW